MIDSIFDKENWFGESNFDAFFYCSQVCCRCSPEQKAQVVRLIQRHSNKTCAAIGDGGNDVSMIQAASAGIGIVGKFLLI